MKKSKSRCMLFVVIVLTFGCFLMADAAENAKSFVGFEFGINYFLPNESTLEGSGRYFSLLFPINENFTVGILHETDKYSGEKTVEDVKVNMDLDITINELKISKDVGFMITPFLGIGSASISNDLEETAIVGDIGVKITPLEDKKEQVKTKLSIDLLYRFMPINSIELYGDNKSVDDLGGFSISANFAMLF